MSEKDFEKIINKWIDIKFEEIAKKLPDLAHNEPASFACGYNTGYKRAVIDLIEYLEKEGMLNGVEEEIYVAQD